MSSGMGDELTFVFGSLSATNDEQYNANHEDHDNGGCDDGDTVWGTQEKKR